MDNTSNETRIDLGDDLLEKTAVLNKEASVPTHEIDPVLKSLNIKAVTPENLEDVLASAKILHGENLFEDAKKLLHQILILSPDHPEARKLLDIIHDTELQQLFGKSAPPSHLTSHPRPPLNSDHYDPDMLIWKLDQDLGLGIFNEAKIQLNQLSLFQDPEDLNAFCDQLEQDLVQSSAQDWIDLGIGFLEIDAYSISSRLFAGACRQLEFNERRLSGEEQEINQLLSATCLLAFSLIQAGKSYEAIAKLNPLIIDVDIPLERKTELFYLMGRIYENMNKNDLAKKYYRQVREIDPNYRDSNTRLKELDT